MSEIQILSRNIVYTCALKRTDGWTLVDNKGGYMAHHEHTVVVTDGRPIILTEMNEIWD